MTLKERLNFAHNGEMTKRFHTVRTIGQNTVGEHSFSVVWLLHLLTDGAASANLLMSAVAHDLAEHVAGDMPSPSKRALGIGEELNAMEERLLDAHGFLFSITEQEQRLLKMADMFSGMLFCVTERAFGNRYISEVYYRFHDYVMELSPEGREAETLAAINDKWAEASL